MRRSRRDFHKIKVETSLPHVNLHYRSDDLDVPPVLPDDRQRMLQLHDAVWSPLDATEIGLTVQASLLAPRAQVSTCW